MNKPPGQPSLSEQKMRLIWTGIVIVLAILMVYGQVRNHAFIDFDDYEYITENPHVRTGLKFENVVWAFTSYHSNNWHPLTWISHMADVALFGLNPGGHHLVNVLFHTANALLLLLVLLKMTGALGPSAFVAALFALHPLHVESVAWAAERKDVLSCFFWLLTTLMYLRYAEKPGMGRYLPVAAMFTLGLMAKQMLVTLPFVLLLLDYWPLGRWQPPARARNAAAAATPRPEEKNIPDTPPAEKKAGPRRARKQSPRTTDALAGAAGAVRAGASGGPIPAKERPVPATRLVLEKLPLFILAAVAAVIVFTVQLHSGVLYNLPQFPLTVRIGNALVSYVAYLGKMFWPVDLSVFYPHPLHTLGGGKIIGAAGLLLAVSALVLAQAKRRPYLAVGWFWYLGTLVPVIGLVQVGVQAMADRYTYIPLIGIFVMIAWGGRDFLAWLSGREAAVAAALPAVPARAPAGGKPPAPGPPAASGQRQREDAVAESRGSGKEGQKDAAAAGRGRKAKRYGRITGSAALAILAILAFLTWRQAGYWRDNITLYEQAIRVVPDNYWAYNNLGAALAARGQLDAAADLFAKSLAIMPTYPGANRNMAVYLYKKGRYTEALPFLETALKVQPRNPEFHVIRGAVLLKLGRREEAAAAFRTALEIRPGDPDAAAGLQEAAPTTTPSLPKTAPAGSTQDVN